jgi:formate dehydrogenase maturation protein FdhE
MADKENVMSWLEGLIEDDWRLFHSDSEVSNIAKAAFDLLKEQKHEKLKVDIRHRNNDGYCPSCGKCIVMDFCPNNCGFCGQAVKWDG